MLNNKLLICSGVLFLTSILGCSKLEDKIISNTDSSDPGIPASAVRVAYQQLQVFTDQANVYALLEHPSDEMMGPTRGTDWGDNGRWRNLHTHTWDAVSSQDIRDGWDQLGTGIVRAYNAISFSSKDPQSAAEGRFLKAFFMYYSVDLYGKVQYKLPGDPTTQNARVMSRSVAVDTIVSNLRASIAALPDGNPASSVTANKATASFLLAKTYLNKSVFKNDPTNPAGPFTFAKSDMDSVIFHCNNILSNTSYSLTDAKNYFDSFSPSGQASSKELIFTLDNKSGNTARSVRNRFHMTLHYNTTPGGWNGFTTLADFYNSFDPADSRLGGAYTGLTDKTGLQAGFLIGQQFDQDKKALKDRAGNPLIFTPTISLTTANESEGIRVIKYIPLGTDVDGNANISTNYVFFRYADVLLMKAEAILRGGTDPKGQTALDLVNQLRAKRGVVAQASVGLTEILAERGRELYWEGWRRNDQIRFGTFNNPDGTGVRDGRSAKTAAFRTVFPIPQRAIDVNPDLKQNPGYN
jgi:starch-binding outer membrane protein, SusD/RagB family